MDAADKALAISQSTTPKASQLRSDICLTYSSSLSTDLHHFVLLLLLLVVVGADI